MRDEEQHGQIGSALDDVAEGAQPGLACPVEILEDHDYGVVGACTCQGRDDRAQRDGGEQGTYGWHERIEGETEVARAGPDEHRHPLRVQGPRSLHHQPGLARTWLARDEDELPCAVLDGGPDVFELSEFGAAAYPGRQLGGPGPLCWKCG